MYVVSLDLVLNQIKSNMIAVNVCKLPKNELTQYYHCAKN